MSKLFNTLEKISRNENVKVSDSVASKAAKPRFKIEKRQGIGIAILVIGIVILAFLLIPKNTNQTFTTQPADLKTIPQRTVETTTPQNLASSAIESPAASQGRATVPTPTPQQQKEFTSLVNQGVELIEKRNYWRGLYLLKQAEKLRPNRFEPLVNSAVALAELGYSELAVSYLKKARELAPDHPALQENSFILSHAGSEEVNNN